MAELRTPVTVVTGLTGTGKTTWIRDSIARGDWGRVAVLTADATALAESRAVVIAISHETGAAVAGCACCVVQGDLQRALRELLPRARRRDVERVVIETDGLADPSTTLTTLMTDPVLASVYRVEEVVAVSDGSDGPVAIRQRALADRVVSRDGTIRERAITEGKAPRGRLVADSPPSL